MTPKDGIMENEKCPGSGIKMSFPNLSHDNEYFSRLSCQNRHKKW